MKLSTGCCLCGVTARAEAIAQEDTPPGPALTVWPPPRAQRVQALQAGLAVVSPHLRSSASTVKALLSTRLETQAPVQSSAAPARLGLPAPPAQSRGGLLERSAKASGSRGRGPSRGGPAPWPARHAVPRHSVLLLVKRGDVGAAQH